MIVSLIRILLNNVDLNSHLDHIVLNKQEFKTADAECEIVRIISYKKNSCSICEKRKRFNKYCWSILFDHGYLCSESCLNIWIFKLTSMSTYESLNFVNDCSELNYPRYDL